MCGRISFSFNRAELLATYAWLRDAPDEAARYNIAPTDPVVAVGPDRADIVRWGIDGRKGGLFNIRAETAIAQALLPSAPARSANPGAGQPLLRVAQRRWAAD